MTAKDIVKAKQKAKDIYFAMLNAGKGITSSYLAEQCAEIAIDELIQATNYNKFWEEVKRQFYKLEK